MSEVRDSQLELDDRNRVFWDELCGSGLAQSLGITELTSASLARFDDAYMGFYPYLPGYLDRGGVDGADVLEIGLGFGTLGAILAQRSRSYVGVDIAEGPVAMMRDRVRELQLSDHATAEQASVLELPFADETFDVVVSIGCLHHTGNLRLAISEVHRVLRTGGRAIVMLYNRHSFRQLAQIRLKRARSALTRDQAGIDEEIRGTYDQNTAGEVAPHTDYVSRKEVADLFRAFRLLRVRTENFDTYPFSVFGRPFVLQREKLLGTVAHLAGLDLYITATK